MERSHQLIVGGPAVLGQFKCFYFANERWVVILAGRTREHTYIKIHV